MAQDIESKIAKLLAKAEANGTTPEEAEVLSAHAEKLMIKYSIDHATIAAKRSSGKVQEQIVTDSMRFHGNYQDQYVTLACGVSEALGNLRSYTYSKPSRSSHGRPAFIVGFESDVKQAIILITSLQIQALNAMNKWWKDNQGMYSEASPFVRLRVRRNFIDAFTLGAISRIREARAAATQEAESKVKGTALVLRDRKTAVDEWLTQNVGQLRVTSSRRRSDRSARDAGYSAGRNAHTGEKSVSNRKQVRG